MAKNIDFMGATFPDVPSIRLPQHEGGLVSFTDVTDTTAVASDVANGKYFYTADGEKTVGTASGGITPSGTISITQNGQVDVTQYAIADVNVSGGGGASNFIRGTFKGTTTGELLLTLPYQGTGYPVSVVVYPTGGVSQSAYSELIQQNALRIATIIKYDTTSAPDYVSTGATGINGVQMLIAYKQNATSATRYTSSSSGTSAYRSAAAGGGSSSFISIHSSTSIGVAIVTGTSTGFAKDIEYTYEVTYSS